MRETGPPHAPKPRVLDRAREALRSRDYSRRTEKAYVGWVRRSILFHSKRHPAEMGPAEITQFPISLAVQERAAASTQNQALGALLFHLFLYRQVEQDLPELDGLMRARRPGRLPVVLSREAVPAILARLGGVPRLIAVLLTALGSVWWSAPACASRASTSRLTRS